jgi:hypothetical protein
MSMACNTDGGMHTGYWGKARVKETSSITKT